MDMDLELKYPGVLAPRQSSAVGFKYVFGKRGFQTFGIQSFASSFPFGLSRYERKVDVVVDRVLVWPRKWYLDIPPMENFPALEGTGGNMASVVGSDADMFRDYRMGDPKRLVNWRLSAKHDSLVIGESLKARDVRLGLVIIADKSRWKPLRRFERMLEYASSFAEELLARHQLAEVWLNGECHDLRSHGAWESLMDALGAIRLGKVESDGFPDSNLCLLQLEPLGDTGFQWVDRNQRSIIKWTRK